MIFDTHTLIHFLHQTSLQGYASNKVTFFALQHATNVFEDDT